MISVEELARQTLAALGMWRLPVDPEAIAREEGIELAPGRYSESFDARIEYVRPPGVFILYYRTSEYGPTPGRVRFSLAHELGHFYLADHRRYLLEGGRHNSVSDFRSKDPREIEADEFAAALLMPGDLFSEAMRLRSLKTCSLDQLCRLAEKTFRASVTSVVRRYCTLDWEPCGMVVSAQGRVRWSLFSDGMRPLGLAYVKNATPVPQPSPTARVAGELARTGRATPDQGRIDAGVWFDRPRCDELWEESMALGRTGLVLTFLVPHQGDEVDDE